MHTSTPAPFTGLWLPLVTPFTATGALDHDALARLVRHYRASGIQGLVACGSTGEAAAMDQAEQLAVLDTVLAHADGLPVAMGVAGHHLGHALAWVKTLARFPLAGLLVSAPMYVRPAQAGLRQWFTALADAAAAPLILYDIPYRTGAHIDTDTLLALAEHPNIQAIKDSGGDPAKTRALITQGRLRVLAGEEAGIVDTIAQGGAGAIVASAHLCTGRFVRLVAAALDGSTDQARQEWDALRPLVDAIFSEPNPTAIKWALARQGLLHNALRPPMTPLSEEGAWRLARVLDNAIAPRPLAVGNYKPTPKQMD